MLDEQNYLVRARVQVPNNDAQSDASPLTVRMEKLEVRALWWRNCNRNQD